MKSKYIKHVKSEGMCFKEEMCKVHTQKETSKNRSA